MTLRERNHNLDFAKQGIIIMFFLHAIVPITLYGRFGALVDEYEPKGTNPMLLEEDITFLLLSFGIGTIFCILIGSIFLIRRMNNKYYSIFAAIITGLGIIGMGACLLLSVHTTALFLFMMILGGGVGFRIIHINKVSMTFQSKCEDTVLPFFHSFYSLGGMFALILCLGLSFSSSKTIGWQYIITGIVVMILEIIVSFIYVPHPYIDVEGAEKQNILKVTEEIIKNRVFVCALGIIFASAFCMGVGNQRIETSLHEELGTSESIATAGYVLFLGIVMFVRFTSRWFLKKINNLCFVIGGFAAGIVGIVMLMIMHNVAGMFIAIVLWAVAVSCSYSIALKLISTQGKNENTESTVMIFISEAFATCVGPLFGLFMFISFPYYFFLIIIAFIIGIISTVFALTKHKVKIKKEKNKCLPKKNKTKTNV